jgi:hypothetical protein
VDLTRCILWILLPLSIVLALLLVSQGVIQNFSSYKEITTLEGAKQVFAMGPAASQIAIKQLGTNGGGFYNVNSAHPYENPTPLANFLEVLSILLIGAALCYTFGRMIGDTRQGWALLAAMTILFVGFLAVCALSEQAGNPILAKLGVEQPLGNMEGKEVRFGVANSALWATATTSTWCRAAVSAIRCACSPASLVPVTMPASACAALSDSSSTPRTVEVPRSISSEICATCPRMAATSPPASREAWPLCEASCRTSSATTANPRPCCPARAASIAALSAIRLVRSAISLMVPMKPISRLVT